MNIYPAPSNFTVDYDRNIFGSPSSGEKEVMSPPPPGPVFVRTSFISPLLMANTTSLSKQQQITRNPQKSTPLTRLMERRASRVKEFESFKSTNTLSATTYEFT